MTRTGSCISWHATWFKDDHLFHIACELQYSHWDHESHWSKCVRLWPRLCRRHRSATVAILSAALLQRQTGAEISVWLPTYDGFLVEEEVVWFHVTVSLKGQSRGGHKKTFVSSVSFLQNSGLSLTPWKCQIFRGTSMKFWKSCWSMSRMHGRSTRSSLSRLLLGCWIVL